MASRPAQRAKTRQIFDLGRSNIACENPSSLEASFKAFTTVAGTFAVIRPTLRAPENCAATSRRL